MSECAGSCATLSQCSIISQSKPLEDLKNKYDERQIAQREMRKNELLEKGDNQNLSTSEAMELAGYRIQDGLEKMFVKKFSAVNILLIVLLTICLPI